MCFSNCFEWFIFIICISPIWGTLLFHAWEASIKPWLVPRDEITDMADALVARHGAFAGYQAWIEEDYAWRRGDMVRQGVWRRVRRELRRRGRGG
ncbi:hypothetical protein [Phyllobacterium calauticae]|jgi:hypothetical protein|uniref:hypothetical protein n=1 Tax=Phyllobacterium calauticae TaxID=2817027 RepID=UPI001CC0D324|nr:hypothetical protein [Phyllobacterium calauticae]MBZ3692081.1 hypothetical protein [Phyllobacterium calauticae]